MTAHRNRHADDPLARSWPMTRKLLLAVMVVIIAAAVGLASYRRLCAPLPFDKIDVSLTCTAQQTRNCRLGQQAQLRLPASAAGLYVAVLVRHHSGHTIWWIPTTAMASSLPIGDGGFVNHSIVFSADYPLGSYTAFVIISRKPEKRERLQWMLAHEQESNELYVVERRFTLSDNG